MKKMKLLSFILTLTLSMLFLVACQDNKGPDGGDPIEVTITLNTNSLALKVGEEATLIPTVKGSTDVITWQSSNATVASVENGKVTALASGSATITAKVGEKTATASVTVTDNPFPVLSVSQSTVELAIGSEGINVTADVKVDGALVTVDFTWHTEDASVATVTNGLIEPVGVGSTEVKVSATYQGTLLEKVIDVTVNLDASVVLSSYDVTLDTQDVDGTQVVSKDVTISTFVNGSETTNETLVITSSDNDQSIVSYELVGYKLTLDAVGFGTAKIQVSFLYEGISVTSEIEVTVNKVTVELETSLSIDKADSSTNLLDLSGFDWGTSVTAILVGETTISSNENALLVQASYVESKAIGDEVVVQFVTKNVIYVANLVFSNSYLEVGFSLPEAGNGSTYKPYSGDVTALGFETDTEVFEYYTGTQPSAWESRLQTNTPLKGYDWWIFDFVLTQVPTGNVTLWIGMFHVVLVNPSGQATLLQAGGNFTGNAQNYDKVHVYNQAGQKVTDGLQANVRYTLEINLEYRTDDPRDSFGIAMSTTMYLANIFAANQAYYDEFIGEKQQEPSETMDVTFSLTSDNTVGASYVFNEEALAYVWQTGNNTNSWSNRIQTTQAIQEYEYLFFEWMLTESLTHPVNFWMDMLSVTTLEADGTSNRDTITFLLDGEIVTGTLEVNKIYQVVIRLSHADEEGRYAIGFNQTTTLYIRNAFAASENYYNTFMDSLVEPKPVFVGIDFSLTADNNVGATYVFNEGANAFVWNTGTTTNAWSNRIQTTNPVMKEYSYLAFQMMLTQPLSNPINFWMDMLNVTTLQVDGSMNTSKVRLFTLDGHALVGAPQANVIYLVVIELGHADDEGRYAFGFNQDTTVYIKDVIATDEAYLIEHVIPKVVVPTVTSKSVSLSLTADNTVGATLNPFTGDIVALGFNASDVVLHWHTGTSTYAWGNRLQTTDVEIPQYGYFVFDMVLSKDLTTDINFWMDMLAPTTLFADGSISTTDKLFIRTANGTLASGALIANTVYHVAILLSHTDEEGRYAFGFNETLDVYLANVKVLSPELYEAYVDQMGSVSRYDFMFQLTSDNNVGATLVIDGSEATYQSGSNTNSWANRLQTTDPNVKGLDYIVMTLSFGSTLTADINFWMDMLKLTNMNSAGAFTRENIITIYDSNNEVVTGALAANTAYTFVIALSHADEEGRYAIGFNQTIEVVISDVYAATEYYILNQF